MVYALYLFIVYSFLGWILEVIYHVTTDGKFINRGLLIGPYCPIYGFGMILILYVLEPYSDNVFLMFVFSVILTTVLEFIGGYLLELFFSQKWWDYSDMPFNIKGYVCLRFSLLWGIGAIISVKFIHVLVRNIYLFLPKNLIIVLTILLLKMMLVDVIITIRNIMGMQRELKRLHEVDQKILKISTKIGEAITDATLKQIHYRNKLVEKFEKDYERMLKAFPDVKSKKYGKIIKYIKDRKNKK